MNFNCLVILLAVSLFGNAESSESTITFVPMSNASIQINIEEYKKSADEFQVLATPMFVMNQMQQHQACLIHVNATASNFTVGNLSDICNITNMPGACFNFQITAMKANASISNFTVEHVCYKPSKPNVTILLQSTNVVHFNITQDGGFANRYEINATIFEHEVKWNCTLNVDTSQFALNSTVLANDCNVTFVPGMCFSLQVIAVSGNATSDAFSANNVCYQPLTPNVTFLLPNTNSIQLKISMGESLADEYEIRSTTNVSDTERNCSFRTKTTTIDFNKNILSRNCSITAVAGMCFHFQISGIRGHAISEAFNASNICFNPSTPNVTFLLPTTNSIQLKISMGDSMADEYEIRSTTNVSGTERNCSFRTKTSTIDFTKNILSRNCSITAVAGMCFHFQISGIRGHAISDAFSASNICFNPSTPNVTFLLPTTNSIQLKISMGDSMADEYEIRSTTNVSGTERNCSFRTKTSTIDFTKNILSRNCSITAVAGMCFHFQISGIRGHAISDAFSASNICFNPSTPNVTFLLPTTNSIQLKISMGDSMADEYEIRSTTNVSGTERNCSFRTKTSTIDFTKNILSRNCSITAVAGMCFHFQISGIRGHAISDAFSASNICFNPSTPNVTFLLPTTNSIQLKISMGDSMADEYEIRSTTNVSGTERNCSFRTKTSTIDFTKNILSRNCSITAVAGMCFHFQISGIRGHAISDAFSASNICFNPSTPNVTFRLPTTNSIQLKISMEDSMADEYEIISTTNVSGTERNCSFRTQTTTIDFNKNILYRNCSITAVAGMCFHFQISGIRGHAISDAFSASNICFNPSTPNVTFRLPTTNSIQLKISMEDSMADEYEIISTTNVSGTERNCSFRTQTTTIDFNKNILYRNCSITAVAGMCFHFQISGIRGHAISDAFSASNICFNPSTPNVTFRLPTTNSIQLKISMEDSMADEYEIISTTNVSGTERNCSFRTQTTTIDFNKNILYRNCSITAVAGMCFHFQISGIRGHAISDAFSASNICFNPSTPNVTVLLPTTNSIQLKISMGDSMADEYEIRSTTNVSGAERNCSFRTKTTTIDFNKYILSRNCSITAVAGMCFHFQISGIRGHAISDAFSASNICFKPSRPVASINSTSTNNIQINVAKGDGLASSFILSGVPWNGGNAFSHVSDFVTDENTVMYNFTSADDPGTCFNFSIAAISGTGKGQAVSEGVVRNGVCYKSSQGEIQPDSVTIKLEFSISVKLDFNMALTDKDSEEYIHLSNEFQTKLTKIYSNIIGFRSIEIIGFTNGSVVAYYIVILNNKDVMLVLNSITEMIHDSLSNLTVSNRTVNYSHLKDTMDKALKNARAKLEENKICELLNNPCPFGYECKSNSAKKIICIERCLSSPQYCANDGVCYVHYKGNEMKCGCSVTEEYYFYGDRCQYKGTKLPEPFSFTPTNYAIIGGSTAAAILVTIVIVLCIRRLQKKLKKTNGDTDKHDDKSNSTVIQSSVRFSRLDLDRSKVNNAYMYSLSPPEVIKHQRVYKDPQTGEEAIIYQPTNMSRALPKESEHFELVQSQQTQHRSFYDYIDTDETYKIRRPNLNVTRQRE